MKGIELIAEERKRQIEKEGFDAKHDFSHLPDELATAAAVYALPEHLRLFYNTYALGNEKMGVKPLWWPFDPEWFKPSPNDRKRELIKAGALIAAELDRIIDQENFEHWKDHKA